MALFFRLGMAIWTNTMCNKYPLRRWMESLKNQSIVLTENLESFVSIGSLVLTWHMEGKKFKTNEKKN